jgi:hypothetical protein
MRAAVVVDIRRFIQLADPQPFFSAVVPESWASLPMGYAKDDNLQIVCPKTM